MTVAPRDLTGFKEPPDSYPGTNVRKLGTPFREPAPTPDTRHPTPDTLGTPETPAATLRGMAGAPRLEVSEVRAMKITMQQNSCTGRPQYAAAVDNTGAAGTGWVNAPPGCPWWYKATQHSADPNGNIHWAVDCMNCGHGGISNPTPRIVQDDMTECVSGSCFVIDFHVELGGQTEASRTLFGNPPNAIENGWTKGVFFLYDPRFLLIVLIVLCTTPKGSAF